VKTQTLASTSKAPTSKSPPLQQTTSQSVSSVTHPRNRRPLEGVVVAFSGYQNPFRSELRDMCLKLGAKYCQDWNDRCTHLICAFPNTPKWRSIKGIGVITSHKWIQACNTAKRRVSWRPFRVGRAPSPPGHVSDTQDVDEDGDNSDWEQSVVEDAASDDWQPGHSDAEDDEEDSGESEEDFDASNEDESSSDEDGGGRKKTGTRRKLPVIHKTSSKAKKPKMANEKKDVKIMDPKKSSAQEASWEPVRRKKGVASKEADVDTDEEIMGQVGGVAVATNGSQLPLPDLPSIFVGKNFYLFSKELPVKEEEILYRLIIAFGGKVHTYMTEDVDFVIAKTSWSDDFDDALDVSSKIIFVKPDWLYACDKAGKFVPFQRYQVVG